MSGGVMRCEKNRREILAQWATWVSAALFSFAFPRNGAEARRDGNGKSNTTFAVTLPPPDRQGIVPLEKTIQQRRTVRSFLPAPLSIVQMAQLLWAAQGITELGGFKRAAPSAGALYPMDVYGVVGKNGVDSLESGVYHYKSGRHQLSRHTPGDLRRAVSRDALSQMWMADAPLILVVTAEYRRVAVKYGDRGNRYAMIEAGHIGQNIFLQAEALGLKAAIVGAFDDRKLCETLAISRTHAPLIMMPVGYSNV